MPTPQLTVGVIGAGIVGLCAALEIQRRGHRVVIVEAGEAGGLQAASYGNGTWINPGAIMPISVPGLWRKVPGFLLDRRGYLVMRWRDLPQLAGWLTRFLLAGRSWPLVEACARARIQLCRDTISEHLALAEAAGSPELIRRDGLTYVYRDRSEFLAEERVWSMRRDFGIAFEELDAAALRLAQPDLDARYSFGARITAGAVIADPGAYCAALMRLAIAQGATHAKARASGLTIEGGRLRAVQTDTGPVSCDKVVIAAGIGSEPLARAAGDRIPLISERGYHVVIPGEVAISGGLMPSDGLMAVVQTPQGLRIAGQVELARVAAEPDWRRVDILLDHARSMYPFLAGRMQEPALQRWMGHRPSTPDGLPSIGPASGCTDVFHCFGHGHTGLTQAPASGRLVAAMIDGARLPFDAAPFSPKRFQR